MGHSGGLEYPPPPPPSHFPTSRLHTSTRSLAQTRSLARTYLCALCTNTRAQSYAPASHLRSISLAPAQAGTNAYAHMPNRSCAFFEHGHMNKPHHAVHARRPALLNHMGSVHISHPGLVGAPTDYLVLEAMPRVLPVSYVNTSYTHFHLHHNSTR